MQKQTPSSQVMNRFRYSTDQVIEKPFNWVQLWRLLRYLKPYSKKLLPLSILMVFLTTAVRLIIPILIGVYVIGEAVTNGDRNLLMILVGGISGLYLMNYVANIYRIRWMNILGQSVIYDLRKHLFIAR